MQAPKIETIARLVHAVRGERVLFDADLASLYGVSTKALNQAVRRNAERFPSDFMFRLAAEEWSNLRSQIVTSSSGAWGGPRYPPYVFTEGDGEEIRRAVRGGV